MDYAKVYDLVSSLLLLKDDDYDSNTLNIGIVIGFFPPTQICVGI